MCAGMACSAAVFTTNLEDEGEDGFDKSQRDEDEEEAPQQQQLESLYPKRSRDSAGVPSLRGHRVETENPQPATPLC